jgi:hypothetical protein
VKHWNDKYGRDRQDETWPPDQTIDIADNLLTYQVKDGGWPKSYNPLLNVPETELRTLLGKSLQHSTLDNRTTCHTSFTWRRSTRHQVKNDSKPERNAVWTTFFESKGRQVAGAGLILTP